MTIREMRVSLGNTQGEFAARYNIPFRTVQNWETGVRSRRSISWICWKAVSALIWSTGER